jgi:hypothetical protein
MKKWLGAKLLSRGAHKGIRKNLIFMLRSNMVGVEEVEI